MRESVLKEYLHNEFSVSGQQYDFVSRCAEDLAGHFRKIDLRARFLQARVLKAFRHHEVASRHFLGSSGYGYGDEGREKLAAVYAEVFGAEDAIVSPLIMSGTHALTEALFGVLRPGQTLLCITGRPYDTLQPVLQGAPGCLEDFGIQCRFVALTDNARINVQEAAGILAEDPTVGMVYLQRSTGYDLRAAFTTEELGDAIRSLKDKYPVPVYMVDNCYGEFVNDAEPAACGADLMAGSLIKNPGGGLTPTGGYIAGRADLIDAVAGRYSAPGIGREVGSYAPGYMSFFEGLFLAPHTVAQALKGVVLASEVFRRRGYEVSPAPDAERGDITQTIIFHDPSALVAFIRAIQKAAPVDAHVVPYPWDMPGYTDQVIMAAGTFVQGASLEYTADGPLRAPYAAYLQGGLTYEHAFLATVLALKAVEEEL